MHSIFKSTTKQITTSTTFYNWFTHFNFILMNYKRWFLKKLAYTNRLTSYQKVASRVGYMGSGFLIAAQWTINPSLYIVGFIFVIVQTSSRKQWNLVALNINGLIAWITHLLLSVLLVIYV
jgi:hypothetical protein